MSKRKKQTCTRISTKHYSRLEKIVKSAPYPTSVPLLLDALCDMGLETLAAKVAMASEYMKRVQ